MRYGWICVTIALMLAAAGVRAQQPATVPALPATAPTAEVQRLIEQLAADDWSTRQKAQDQLVSLADDTVPALERLLRQAADEEARNRAEAALAQIAENRLIGPTFVTLHHKAARPKVVMADIARQTKLAWVTDPPDLWNDVEAGYITIDLDRQPLCVALRDFCRQAHVRPMPGSEPGKLLLSNTGEDDGLDGLASPSGAFVAIAQQITLNKTVKLGGGQAVDHDFSIQFLVLAEPKLRILGYTPNIRMEEAEDEKGNKLTVGEPEEIDVVMGNPQSAQWTPSAQLNYPANAGKRIAKFRGLLACVVQIRGETLAISEVLKAANVARDVAGARFTLKKVKVNGREYEVELSVARQGLNDLAWQRVVGLVTSGQTRLVDGRGQPLVAHGVNNGSDKEDRLDVTLLYTRPEDGVGEPARLMLEVPVEAKEIKIPVELGNLPMP